MIHSISLKEEPSSLISPVKFFRREDLTVEKRLKIASIALFFQVKGGKSGMAKRHGVSRTFIYQLREQLAGQMHTIFGAPSEAESERVTAHQRTEQLILLLRLVGACSIGAISLVLNALEMPYDSVGFISQHLHRLGAGLPNVVAWQGRVIYGSDELFFLGRHPILITVDVVSGAILHIEKMESLTKAAWQEHWQRLREKGIEPIKLLSDEGTTLRAAREDFQDLAWQPDTFHAISLRLGVFQQRLLRQAEKAIEQEYKRENKKHSAKSAAMKQKQQQSWEQARQNSLQALRLYEDFRFLYQCMLEQNQVFQANGQARLRTKAEAETRLALELMRTLSIPGLNKELDEILHVLPHLYGFLDGAQPTLALLSQTIEPALLPFWTCAWQAEKKASKAKRNYSYQKRCRDKAALALELLQQHYQMDEKSFEALRQSIFLTLDAGTAQSSAMVECVNSFLRPYLNECRDQITQEFLQLLMFYYNHRIFQRGKRKGKAPIEILSKKPLEQNWLNLLLQAAKA